MHEPIGLVLAGGRGRRMGRAKGGLRLAGRALAARAAAALDPVCGGVVVSVACGAPNPVPGRPAIEDRPPAGRGPLAGIEAAFAETGEADLLVLACDYPRVTTELLRCLLRGASRDAELVLPRDGAGNDHPLVGLWRRAAASRVTRALERAAYRVADLVSASRVLRLEAPSFPGLDLDRMLVNVNLPSDLDSLREEAPRRDPG
jgi:molybdopterin-guanine dinucleotide biosynthesis protein A